jgi:hypothetical protein
MSPSRQSGAQIKMFTEQTESYDTKDPRKSVFEMVLNRVIDLTSFYLDKELQDPSRCRE